MMMMSRVKTGLQPCMESIWHADRPDERTRAYSNITDKVEHLGSSVATGSERKYHDLTALQKAKFKARPLGCSLERIPVL